VPSAYLEGAQVSYCQRFICGHSRTKKIGDGDGGDDQDEGNDSDAKVAENEARGGDALTLQAARTFADFRNRKMAQNYGDDGSRQEEKKDPANQAANGFATGGWLKTGGKRGAKGGGIG
jgi:hypothetical protein